MSISILACAYRGLSAATHMSVVSAVSVLGWRHRIVTDDALLDHARGVLVSGWYRDTDDDVFVMVDDDIVFSPDHLMQLVTANVDVVSATYPSRLGQTLTGTPLDPGVSADALDGCELIELDRAGMGCIAVRRHVIERLTESMAMCDAESPTPFWPLFFPMIRDGAYVGEDTAFSYRVREAGFHVWLSPQTRVVHMSNQFPVSKDNMFMAQVAVQQIR